MNQRMTVQIQEVSRVGIAARMRLRVGRPLASVAIAALLFVCVGRVLYAKEVQVDTKSAPAVVQATLAKAIGDKLPKKLEKEKKDGGVVYTGKFKVDGYKRSARISESGELLRVQVSLGETELPQAVRKAINARYAKAEIKECKAVHLKGGRDPNFFKIELGGKLNNTKLKLKPNGEIYND